MIKNQLYFPASALFPIYVRYHAVWFISFTPFEAWCPPDALVRSCREKQTERILVVLGYAR